MVKKRSLDSMPKQMIYIRKDVEPLFKLEKNKSKLVSDLLVKYYAKTPLSYETNNVASPTIVTKSEPPTQAVDGFIDDSEVQVVDGRIPGGDQTDGAVWN